jgi:hypothetical protein
LERAELADNKAKLDVNAVLQEEQLVLARIERTRKPLKKQHWSCFDRNRMYFLLSFRKSNPHQ